MRVSINAAVFACAAVVMACGSGGGDPPGDCPASPVLGGLRAGVPADAICGDTHCAAGVTCATVVNVSDRADLDAALAAGPTPGVCLALGDGAFGAVTLPAGVNLLGRGAASTTLDSLEAEAEATTATTIRGVAVGAGGIQLTGAGEVTVESVRVTGAGCSPADSLEIGIDVRAGVDATILTSTIDGAHCYGVMAFDSGDVTMRQTVVNGADGGGPGLWFECSAGCGCVARAAVSLEAVAICGTGLVGAGFGGVDASLSAVSVTRSHPYNFENGGGVAIFGCANVGATGMTIADNTGYGIFVDHSQARLGGSGADEGIEVARNNLGIWVQDLIDVGAGAPADAVVVSNAVVVDNGGVGVGLGPTTSLGTQHGIIIQGTTVSGTRADIVPTVTDGVPGMAEVGDGVVWREGARATLDGLTLAGNDLAGILIDGEVEGTIASVPTFMGGDEDHGIIIQGNPATLPAGLDAVPANLRLDVPDGTFAVPAGPNLTTPP